MEPEKWSLLREVFGAAALLAPAERASFLDRECGGDAELRREVESLLRHDPGPGPGAADAAADTLTQEPGGGGGSTASLVGGWVGKIRILSLLGEGGMGEVYVGFDETLHRRVAVKAIRAKNRLAAESRARFLREARILSQLEHPHICRVYDYVEGDDSDFLVLELIDGVTLSEKIDAGLEPGQRMAVAIEIAEVLAAAHAKGVVHRDLKPQNVMITAEGETKVLDFGLARLEAGAGEAAGEEAAGEPRGEAFASPAVTADETAALPAEGHPDLADETALLPEEGHPDLADETAALPEEGHPDLAVLDIRTRRGAVVGTPIYMSPEQAHGEPVTTASDMYSYGLVLQTLFTGEAPYPRGLDGPEILARARRAETRPATGIDRDLAAFVGQLKSVAPAERPTAATALERLRWIRNKPARRLRRLLAAAVLAAFAVGGAKYTFDLRRERTIALEARDEADLRRGQAEDLIGFMLGDLREKLAPVGRLEILDDVGGKALEYFASLPEGSLSDDELARRAKALYQIGEVRIAQGDLPAAEEPLRESLALAQELSARDPADGARLFGLGQSHFWLGNVHWLQGDLEAALRRWEEYREISQRLLALDPENLDWQQEVAYAYANLGALYEARGDLDRALETIRLSNGIKHRLAAAEPVNPDRARSLANGLSWLAATLLRSGRIPESLQEYRAELEIRRSLAREDPLNTDSRYLLSISNSLVGHLLLMSGEIEAALDHHRKAKALMHDLVAHDLANLDWRRGLAASYLHAGDALLEAGQIQRARADLQTALVLLIELTESDSSNDDWRHLLGVAHQKEAAILLVTGEAAAAVEAARQALAVLDPLGPNDRKAAHIRSQVYILLGRGEARAGRPGEARAAWNRALAILEPLGSTARAPQVLDPRVRALLYLGRAEEAKPILAALTKSGYARPDFIALCRERELLSEPGIGRRSHNHKGTGYDRLSNDRRSRAGGEQVGRPGT